MPKVAATSFVVAIGSKNRAKVEGVKRVFGRFFPAVSFSELDLTTKVKIQPLSLHETVKGAEQRAKSAIREARADFGVGVEAGIIKLVDEDDEEYAKGGGEFFLNLQIASVVDSVGRLSFGCSSGFPIPTSFVTKLKQNGEELDRYTHDLTGVGKVGEEEGIIYRLSKERLSRLEMTEQCVMMALIPWLNRDLYGFKEGP